MPGFDKSPSMCSHSAINHLSTLVDNQDAIRIAIKGNANICPHFADFFNQARRRCRAHFVIDVETIGLDANRKNFSAQFPECFGSRFVTRAIGTIDHNAQTIQREIARQGALGKFNIAGAHVIDALGATQIARGR